MIENLRGNQIEILELKGIITEVQNSPNTLGGFKVSFELAKGGINEPKLGQYALLLLRN